MHHYLQSLLDFLNPTSIGYRIVLPHVRTFEDRYETALSRLVYMDVIQGDTTLAVDWPLQNRNVSIFELSLRCPTIDQISIHVHQKYPNRQFYTYEKNSIDALITLRDVAQQTGAAFVVKVHCDFWNQATLKPFDRIYAMPLSYASYMAIITRT